MSYLGIVFTFVFGGNVLFQYGAGTCSYSAGVKSHRGISGVLTLGITSLAAAALHVTVMRFILYPLGIEVMEPLAYVLIVAMTLYAIVSILASGSNPILSEAGKLAKTQVLSCVVYAASLAAVRGRFTFMEAVAAGFAAALGWWAAAVLLDRIVQRLELEEIPPVLSGIPLRFISAGLMAMAFSGIDSLLVSRLVG